MHGRDAYFGKEDASGINLPKVMDADGLNVLAADRRYCVRRKAREIVITPHPGEMARLRA